MRISDRLSRAGNLFLAVCVGMVAVTCTARAVTSVKAANSAIVSYALVAGANSAPVFPPASQGVFVMGVCNTFNFRGTGHVALLRVPGAFLEWTGLNSPSAATRTFGFSSGAGTKIVGIDFSGNVQIQVNTADSFRIHNGSAADRAGNVTMFW